MKFKNKLLAALLILVFIASVGCVVAQDTVDDELTADNADDAIAVSDDNNEPLAVEENTQTLAAEENSQPVAAVDESAISAGADSSSSSNLDIKIEVLDKNPKVGDTVRVKVTVKNLGSEAANNVLAGFSFTDLLENPDASFELVDGGGHTVPADGGYEVDFGIVDAGETKSVIVTFKATEAGTKKIVSNVASDSSNGEADSEDETTITVSEDSASDSSNNNAQASTSKTLHATGNPLALLALALFCIVPYYRRK